MQNKIMNKWGKRNDGNTRIDRSVQEGSSESTVLGIGHYLTSLCTCIPSPQKKRVSLPDFVAGLWAAVHRLIIYEQSRNCCLRCNSSRVSRNVHGRPSEKFAHLD